MLRVAGDLNLRNYPPRFGEAIVRHRDALLSSGANFMSKLPADLPIGPETFARTTFLEEHQDLFANADFGSVAEPSPTTTATPSSEESNVPESLAPEDESEAPESEESLHVDPYFVPVGDPQDEKLRNAAKARIRRMCQRKLKRTDLEAPEWVRKEWEKGSKSREHMAEILQAANWSSRATAAEAKVPCSVAIRTAKAVTEEVPAARTTSIAALAHCTESHSERDVQRLSDKYGLKLPIPISQTPVGDSTIPFLKMRHWAEFIESRNLWHMLCGLDRADHDACDRRWKLFWERYQRINPGHEVFQRAARGEIDLCKTAGLLLHGDEGRSLKKSAILVVSCHSVLGYGLSTSSKANKAETNKLNFEQPTWTTRYLLSVVPKSYYSEESGGDKSFQQVLAAVAGDLRDLYDHGIVGPWGRHFYCIINIVGDWPWMIKAGLLARSFQNVAKHGRPAAKAKAAPKGICHQCLADYGRDGVVWEDFESEVPDWVSTMNQVSPFLDTPAVLVLPHDQQDHPSLFSWDIFHGWHLGSGKIFLASAFVCILISDIFEGSVETKIDALNTHYWTWCKINHKKPIKKFTRAGLNWLTSTAYPSGGWSKGDATTQLMKYFLTFCRDYLGQVRANALLSLAFQAGEAMDQNEPGPPGSPAFYKSKSLASEKSESRGEFSEKSENSLRDKHAPVCNTSFSRKSAFMAKPKAVANGANARRNSLKEGREQRNEARAKKKKLPNGFALDRAEGDRTRSRRISQLPALPQSKAYSRWTRARLWLLPVVRHKYFNFLAATLILSNALFMGVETAWITCASGDAEGIGWYITNVCFTQLFLMELLVRWFVDGRHFWFDVWNIFDAVLVLFSLFDDPRQQNLGPETTAKEVCSHAKIRARIIASLSSLAWAWLLLIVMMYLPAIFVTQTFGKSKDPDPQLVAAFGSLPQSMYTLFKVMTMETWPDLARHAGKVSPGAEIFFVLYIFCTSFAVMNVVVAVIVQNTCIHAKERQEDMRSERDKKDANAMLKVLEVFQTADVHQSGQISKKDFLKAMDMPSVMQLMHEVQIDVRQAEALFDVLDYNNSGTLDSEEFLEGIMLARGEARSREVIAAQCDLWKDEHDTIKTLEELEDEICEAIDGLNGSIESLRHDLRAARGVETHEDQTWQWLFRGPSD
eukprot:s802_g6.t1